MAKPEVFARRIVALAAGVTSNTADAKAAVAKRAGRAVVRATPVDTTKARSNWVGSGGAPDLSERANRSESETVSEIDFKVSQVPFDEDIHVANGGEKVPYLGKLESGCSQQAPAGFVAEAAQRGLKALERVRILKRRRR